MSAYDSAVYRRGKAKGLGICPELDVYPIFLRFFPSKVEGSYLGMMSFEDTPFQEHTEGSCGYSNWCFHYFAKYLVWFEEVVVCLGFWCFGSRLGEPFRRRCYQ